MSDVDLEDALDGLMDATEYCDDVGLHELAKEIADCYQELGKQAPEGDWDSPTMEEVMEENQTAEELGVGSLGTMKRISERYGDDYFGENPDWAEDLPDLGECVFSWPDGVISVDEGPIGENEPTGGVFCDECGQESVYASTATTEEAGFGPCWACVNCGWVDRI